MNARLSPGLTVIAGLALLTGFAASSPDEPRAEKTGTSRPADQQLLKQLNAGSNDELDRELFGPEEGPAKPAESRSKPPLPPGKTPDRISDRPTPQAPEADHPLLGIARHMREAERLIAQNDSGQTTRQLQDQILADLDELLKKTCSQCSGEQGAPKDGEKPKAVAQRKMPGETKRNTSPTRVPKGLKPTEKTAERATSNRPVTAPTPEETRELVRALWGILPEREREQMMHLAPPEEFLPKYESLIEDYFRRLAGEKEPR